MLKIAGKFSTVFLSSAIALMAVMPVTASAEGTVALAVAHVNAQTGAELSVGFKSNGDGPYIAPAIGIFGYSGDNKDFAMQAQSNGTDVCRDLRSGQYAKKEKCDSMSVKGFATLEVGYQFKPASLGLGVRVGDKALPYLTTTVGQNRQRYFKVAAGKDYASLGFVGSF